MTAKATTYIYDMETENLADNLVGKSIKSIAGQTIELSDGTILQIEDTAECCSWFDGTIEAFDFEDNVITRVERVEAKAQDEYDDAWSLHVFSAHKLIAKVNIEGNESNGYYAHSVNLRIVKKLEEN